MLSLPEESSSDTESESDTQLAHSDATNFALASCRSFLDERCRQSTEGCIAAIDFLDTIDVKMITQVRLNCTLDALDDETANPTVAGYKPSAQY